MWRLPVSALAAASVIIVATACGGNTRAYSAGEEPTASGGTTPAWSPPPSTPTVSPEDLDPSTYQSLSPRDYALLVKDPGSNKGRKIVVYGIVTQFDAATGKSELRANTGAQPGDYLQNTMIDAKDPSILTNVVEKDVVKMWCQVQGADTYKTTMGGQLTVPRFWVYIIKDAGSSGPIP
jgi:hypothetical protein